MCSELAQPSSSATGGVDALQGWGIGRCCLFALRMQGRTSTHCPHVPTAALAAGLQGRRGRARRAERRHHAAVQQDGGGQGGGDWLRSAVAPQHLLREEASVTCLVLYVNHAPCAFWPCDGAGQGGAGLCDAAAGERPEVPRVWAPHLHAGCHRACLQPLQKRQEGHQVSAAGGTPTRAAAGLPVAGQHAACISQLAAAGVRKGGHDVWTACSGGGQAARHRSLRCPSPIWRAYGTFSGPHSSPTPPPTLGTSASMAPPPPPSASHWSTTSRTTRVGLAVWAGTHVKHARRSSVWSGNGLGCLQHASPKRRPAPPDPAR